MKEKLKQFLEENNAWEAYLENFHNPEAHTLPDYGIYDVQSLWNLLPSSSVEPKGPFQSAFVWKKTKEGFQFWHELQKKWLERFEQEKEVTK